MTNRHHVALRRELSFPRGSSQRHFGKLRKRDPLLFIIVCRSLLFIILKATMHVLVPNQFAVWIVPPVAPALRPRLNRSSWHSRGPRHPPQELVEVGMGLKSRRQV